MAQLTYREAIARAIAQEMRRDESVVFLGEDIAAADLVEAGPAEADGKRVVARFYHRPGHRCNDERAAALRMSDE